MYPSGKVALMSVLWYLPTGGLPNPHVSTLTSETSLFHSIYLQIRYSTIILYFPVWLSSSKSAPSIFMSLYLVKVQQSSFFLSALT